MRAALAGSLGPQAEHRVGTLSAEVVALLAEWEQLQATRQVVAEAAAISAQGWESASAEAHATRHAARVRALRRHRRNTRLLAAAAVVQAAAGTVALTSVSFAGQPATLAPETLATDGGGNAAGGSVSQRAPAAPAGSLLDRASMHLLALMGMPQEPDVAEPSVPAGAAGAAAAPSRAAFAEPLSSEAGQLDAASITPVAASEHARLLDLGSPVSAPDRLASANGANDDAGARLGGTRVASNQLEDLRGGFESNENGQALRIRFGIERSVYQNGELIATRTIGLDHLPSVDGGGFGSVVRGYGVAATLPPSLASAASNGLVIQNALNDQRLHAQTVVNAVVESSGLLRATRLDSIMRDVSTSSILR